MALPGDTRVQVDVPQPGSDRAGVLTIGVLDSSGDAWADERVYQLNATEESIVNLLVTGWLRTRA